MQGCVCRVFGYIKPWKPQLRICEFDTYKAIYCGLCKQLSHSYGPFARLTLSYDFTFLALLDMALGDESPQFKTENCLYNPLKKKPCCVSCQSLHYSASVAMLIYYYKILDNIQDERYPKKLLYRLALPFARRARKKAAAEYPKLDRRIGEQMKDQAALEQNNCDSVDRASEPTANCLAFLFEELSQEEGERRVLSRLGYLLGRWVYLCDALDDIGEDIAKKRYNPFVLRSGAPDGLPLDRLREEAVFSLNLTMGEIVKSFDLLRLRRYEGILSNVINLGLKATVQTLASGPETEKDTGV